MRNARKFQQVIGVELAGAGFKNRQLAAEHKYAGSRATLGGK